MDSPHLAQLRSLYDVSGVRYVALEVGAAARPAGGATPGLNLVDVSGDVRDLADAAAVIGQLDLVIAADGAAAHLAGALGKPVWTLVRFAPDWPWGAAGDDTPWYPTMRLFRQTAPGDWSDVIAQLGKELRARVPGRSSIAA